MSGAASEEFAGWNEFIECLRTLPARMLAKLPEVLRGDAQMRQEIARLALEALACSTIDALGSDVNHPVFLSQIGEIINVGQPNADTIYRMARIAPDGVYRLRGRRGYGAHVRHRAITALARRAGLSARTWLSCQP